MIESLECNKILTLSDFNKVVGIAVKKDIDQHPLKHYYNGAALHEWIETDKEKLENEQFESKEDIFAAFLDLTNLNPEFKVNCEIVARMRFEVMRAF